MPLLLIPLLLCFFHYIFYPSSASSTSLGLGKTTKIKAICKPACIKMWRNQRQYELGYDIYLFNYSIAIYMCVLACVCMCETLGFAICSNLSALMIISTLIGNKINIQGWRCSSSICMDHVQSKAMINVWTSQGFN